MRFVKTAENLFGLPLGFTRVEYLQSTGTQYIDTGYKLSTGTTHTFSGNIMWTQSNGTANFFYGYRSVNSATYQGDMRAFFVYGQSGGGSTGRLAIRYGVNTDNSTSTISLNKRYTLSFDGTNLKVDGTTFVSKTSSYTPANYQNMYLFWCNCTGYYSDDVAKFSGRIYNWQIFEDGVAVRDFIPCIDPLGVACMYDLVGKKPYYNQGTGSFIVGRQIIPVEYLQSSGTQYINTGVLPTQLTEVEYRCAVTGSVSNNDSHLFGSRLSASSEAFDLAYMNTPDNGLEKFRFIHGTTTSQETTTSVTASQLANPHTYYMSGTSFKVDGSEKMSFTTTSFTGSYSLWLFGVNSAGSLHNQVRAQRVYKCKIWNSGTLVRDFIPCKDENNVGFMFNKVSGTCYLNAGTGAFSVGKPVYTSKLRLIKDAIRLPDGYTRVEYLESTGTQYIDMGYPIVTSTDEIVVEYENTSTQTHKWLFGSYESNANIGISSGTLTSPTFWYKGSVNSTEGAQYNSRHILKYDSTGMSNDGINLKAFTSYTGTWNLYLFALNNTGTSPNGYFGYGKIYSYKHKRNGVLIRSFIPVRDSNNVGYMFDEVTGQIFGNAGSGSFVVGNDLPTAKVRFIQDVLPREYRPLKYIQSTGTQYIDTGYNAKSTLKTDIYFEVVDKTQGGHIFGGRTVTSGGRGYGVFLPTTGGIGFDYETRLTSNVSTTNGYRYRVVKDGASNTLYVNGVQSYTGNNTDATFDLNVNMALFYMKDINTPFNVSVKCKVFYFKIYDNGVPVRDFYPALRKSDNKPGMYDRITKQFFVNQGTGEFNYG